MKELNSSCVVVSMPICRRLSANKTSDDWQTHYLLIFGIFVILFCGFLLSGCGTKVPTHRQMAPLPDGPVCRVAVLPFLNDSDFPLGEVIVSKVFAMQFQDSHNSLVIQEGDILKVYQQLHILPGEAPTLEQLQIIADRTNADLLITGIVLELREDPDKFSTVNPMLILDIQIRDGRSGETLWNVFHRRKGTDYNKAMHFGTIHTVTGLSRQMAEEIINLWFKKGLIQCDESP